MDCDIYNTDRFFLCLREGTIQQNDVPFLDVSTAYNNGEVVASVVNRHKDKPITTGKLCQTDELSGNVKVYQVNDPNVKYMNNFDAELIKTVTKPEIKGKDAKITYSLLPIL